MKRLASGSETLLERSKYQHHQHYQHQQHSQHITIPNDANCKWNQSNGSPLSSWTHSSPSPSIGFGVAGPPPNSAMVGWICRKSSSGSWGTMTPMVTGSSVVHGLIGSSAAVILGGSSVVIVRTVIGSAVGVVMLTSSTSSTGSQALARISSSSVANFSSTAAIFVRVRWAAAAVHQASGKACGSHLVSSC
ncbi:hypothetical protein GQX74_014280 [Glossina fuscipes]|nr:hypothetical protein GQX74_014280 [Glossina fuscipes]